MKVCKKCSEKLEEYEFHKSPSSKDGLKGTCKLCIKNWSEKYYMEKKDRWNKYQKDNEAKIRDYQRQYRSDNRENLNTYCRERKKSDPIFKLKCNLRTRTSMIFSSNGYIKEQTTQSLIGTTYEDVKIYITQLFKTGMTWDNYGEWQIDHIIPLASAKSEEQLIKLCHYKNLQPLWALENNKKGTKIIDYAICQ